MTICYSHRKTDPFTRIDKAIVFDSSISLKAKGLLLIAFSRPEDWKFTKSELMKHAKDKETSFDSGIKELEKAGYLHRRRSRCQETNQFTGWEWHFYETPISEEKFKKNFRNGGFPGDGEAWTSGKPGTTKNDSCTKKEEQQHSPQKTARRNTPDASVVVFPCLYEIELEEWYRKKVMTLGRAEKAVQRAVRITKDANPNCVQAFFTDCLNNPKKYSEKRSPKSQTRHNKALLRAYLANIDSKPTEVVIEPLNANLEVYHKSGGHPVCIDWTDSKFDEKLLSAFERFEVWLK